MHDARIGRFLSIDPEASKMPWGSPYAAFDNSPIWKVDPQGDIPFLFMYALRKAGDAVIGMATDMMIQVAAEKYFGNNGEGHGSWEEAWDAVDIDEFQVLSSGGEALIKNKHLAAAFSAASDMTNYLITEDDPTFEGAMTRGGLAVFSAYLGGGVSNMISRYGVPAVRKGLSSMGLSMGDINLMTLSKGFQLSSVGKYGISEKALRNNFSPGASQGFTGVFNIKTGGFTIAPSGSTDISRSSFESNLLFNGGHRQLAKMLQGSVVQNGVDRANISDLAGFAIEYTNTSTLSVRFRSGLNTDNGIAGPDGRTLASEYQTQVIDVLKEAYPGFNIVLSNN